VSSRALPPFRADHVGSLLRPPELIRARAAFAEGRLDADGLRDAEDIAIRQVVALQEEVGLRSATDGEFRRTSWHMDFIYQLGGVSPSDEQLQVAFKNDEGSTFFTSAALKIKDKVRLDRTIFADAFKFLQSVTTTAVPKPTIPSPNMVHYRGGAAAIDPAVYRDIEDFWADLSAAYAEEVRRLGQLGCTYLQLAARDAI
jgi:5-methyltetrahydropteroyltriglutamate--homocysteine methyltransferase